MAALWRSPSRRSVWRLLSLCVECHEGKSRFVKVSQHTLRSTYQPTGQPPINQWSQHFFFFLMLLLLLLLLFVLFNWVFGVLRGFRGFCSSSPPPAARRPNGSPGPRSAAELSADRKQKNHIHSYNTYTWILMCVCGCGSM